MKIGPAKKVDRHDLQKFTLYRAAKVSQHAGKQFFAVVNAEERLDSGVNAAPFENRYFGRGNQLMRLFDNPATIAEGLSIGPNLAAACCLRGEQPIRG